MWQIILYSVISFAALYAFTATVFLLLAQLEKNAQGKLVLDPDSWHFRIAYPKGYAEVKKALNVLKGKSEYSEDGWMDAGDVERKYAEITLASYRSGRCAYFFQFFLMLYFGWPFFAISAVFLGVTFNFFTLPFGRYYRALASTLQDKFISKKYPLPRVYGVRLLPIYFIAPLLYGALWYFYPGVMSDVTGVLLIGIGTAILVAFVIWGIKSAISVLRDADEKSVNMVREWIAAKKEGVCPTIEIKIPDA